MNDYEIPTSITLCCERFSVVFLAIFSILKIEAKTINIYVSTRVTTMYYSYVYTMDVKQIKKYQILVSPNITQADGQFPIENETYSLHIERRGVSFLGEYILSNCSSMFNLEDIYNP